MRLLIVDDHELVREALRSRLELMPGIEVVGSAADGAQALDMVQRLAPDLVVLDFHMPRMNGGECAHLIQELRPECRILFLTGFPDDERLLDSANVASGFVTKSASWALFEQALEAIIQGKAFVDPNLVPAILTRAAAVDNDTHLLARIDPHRVLAPTESRVAVLAARGRSNLEISAELGVSGNTVKAHLQHVFHKLNVHGRKELAARTARVEP